MREIKFRALDTDNQEMVNWETLREDMFLKGIDIFNTDTLIPMQFTGLKDKNGVEIYEGDIVECVSNYIYLMSNQPTGKVSREVSEIIWHEAMWTYKKTRDGYITKLSNTAEFWAKYFEVIGNIHENSELLK